MHDPWDEFLQDLPLILAGPILQHTDPESVTVWIALRQACQVSLQVYTTSSGGAALDRCLLSGERSTVALGESLHVVAVTARAAEQTRLTQERLYAYDLQFRPTGSGSSPAQTLGQALCSSRFPTVKLSYFPHQKPTFVLPPARLQDLKIAQGSCRKPHGNGFDALPILDDLIAVAADRPRQRPQQLFLTGDQIYGDDVAAPLLWVASHLATTLLGWEEQLPVGQARSKVVKQTPKELPPGQRAEVATTEAGFTAGLRHQRQKVTSHLFSFGEYFASYLLAWSPICWPVQIPAGQAILRDRKAQRQWDREARNMRQFIHTLWKVRRALANIPTYTIFDDHDVSDDWNLNQAWCIRVLGKPLGRRVVQNALLAYALSQAWGNQPAQFEANQSGAQLLAAVQRWSASQGRDRAADQAIARYLGMPDADPKTGLPRFVRDGPVLVLNRHSEALTWHYTVRGPCHEVVVLDTRTRRGYPAEQKPIAPPRLLCPQAFDQQLRWPLQQTAQSDAPVQLTFVIAPTNLFGLRVIDWIHHWQLRRNKVFAADVGDAWNINMEALAELLTTLFEQRQQVVVLSGDIHYSSVAHLSTAATSQVRTALIQLTSSALKNEETLTRLIHTRLKDWLLPEKQRHWWGWNQPLTMVERPRRFHQNSCAKPDWQCQLNWVPRHPAQTPAFGAQLPWLLPGRQQARRPWRQRWRFWRSRWWQEGREVVGLNNLALVHLGSQELGRVGTISQDVYWFTPWWPISVAYSRFESPLAPARSPEKPG